MDLLLKWSEADYLATQHKQINRITPLSYLLVPIQSALPRERFSPMAAKRRLNVPSNFFPSRR